MDCNVSSAKLRHYRRTNITFSTLFSIYCSMIIFTVSISIPAIGEPVVKEESSTFFSIDESPVDQWQTVNGSGNNLAHSDWGSAGDELKRISSVNFTDNISTMANTDFSNPREISNTICTETEQINDTRGLSSINAFWGEFVRNDIQLTSHQNSQHEGGMEESHILIPVDDEIMNPTHATDAKIKYIRTEFIAGTGTDDNNPREYANEVSSWIDGSSIYGHSVASQDVLRTGEGGLMKVTDWQGHDMIPAFDYEGFVPTWDGSRTHANLQFVLGDGRNLDHIGISSLHLLFLLEHNRLADAFQKRNPDWSDEQLFQKARKLVIAQIQVITYSEYLPSLGIDLPTYSGYDETVNPQISNEFFLLVATSVESQRTDGWLRLNASRAEISEGNLDLNQGYWSSDYLLEAGVEPLMRGAAYEIQRENDLHLAPSLRNLMSGAMWGGWMDDCAMDIQRGRDRGLTDYNSIRESLGLGLYDNWSNLTSDVELQEQLASVYADINHMDAVVGVLAEPRLPNSSFGESQYQLAFDQYSSLRDGDRHWYANDPELVSLISELNQTRLADIILRNSEVESIQCNVFYAESNSDKYDCHLSNMEVNDPSVVASQLEYNIMTVVGVSVIVILIAVPLLVTKRNQELETDSAGHQTQEEEE
ncbi:MAG TPA: peroxidase family protein [Candidatus Thalassarchaeaceae archaeon]|nr:peroxidase family protein [Candidatus Thalassarchaeaceae archaeon]